MRFVGSHGPVLAAEERDMTRRTLALLSTFAFLASSSAALAAPTDRAWTYDQGASTPLYVDWIGASSAVVPIGQSSPGSGLEAGYAYLNFALVDANKNPVTTCPGGGSLDPYYAYVYPSANQEVMKQLVLSAYLAGKTVQVRTNVETVPKSGGGTQKLCILKQIFVLK